MLEWLLLGMLLFRGNRDAAVRTANANAVKEVTARSGIKYRVTLLRSFGNGQNEFNVSRFITERGFSNLHDLITYRQNADRSRVLVSAAGSSPAITQARKDFGV